ncbi:hypothetical protein K492DRAFT_142497 [Lichtheimia hyalospora FSU 10163]|nr:hypothetical protein K492DRAFT_142497 [Lichtheimia hyalospora FSU 10163]
MGSSMESQEQQPSLESLNVDGNVSLLSSPNASTPEQPNDDAMDLFLNQVADYNSQHLNLNHHDANNNHCAVMDPSQVLLHHHHQQQHQPKMESAAHSLDGLCLENQHLLNVDGTSKPALETSSDGGSSSVATTTTTTQQQQQKPKGKGKESNGGGGLLNAFANPLLHAIPVLARNCLNFEDFLAQAALQGQNGLLGPKMQKADNYAAPDKLMLDPTKESFSGKVGSPWHIRVLGLPSSGAKSRVETQIKVCIQLVNSNNELANEFSHLRLPEHMVAKEKLKRKHQKGDDRSALVESKVLRLEAAVVCDSHPDNEIIMCTSCVHRERKRLKRKRDNKVARAANKEGNAAKLAALFANDLPNLEDEEVMAQERRKILLFNCSEYIEFNEGEATLPTRVTCYCRHHSEKIGFRIVFTVKDSQNHVLATGRSPPIMITDDHKSSKVQTAAAAVATANNAAAAARKRTRSEFDVPEVPSSVKRKALNDGETDSGVSSPSPIVSAPPTPTSQGDDVPSSPKRKQQHHNGSIATSSPSNHSSSGAQSFLSHQPSQSSSFSNNIQQIPQGELFDFLHSEDINMDHLLQAPSTTVPESSHQASVSNSSSSSSTNTTQRHVPLQSPFSAPLYRSRRTNGVNGMGCSQQQQQWQASNLYARMQQKNAMMERTKSSNLPKLHRLIPSEGPIYGGAEVTVLGANFYEGLTCMFGENPAMPTHCWSANTLLCILPPAANAGPVVVSFKEHPLMLEGQDVVLFTYFDESDRALMELALQVVGLKTMGRVEDARQIAMRIVQGDHGNSSNKDNSTTTTTNNSNNNNTNHHDALSLQTPRVGYRQMLTTKAAMAVYENARALCIGGRLEDQVIAALVSAMDYYNDELSLTNGNQHSLLHLATICGYGRLVRVLVKLGCDVNQPDHNGFTALHFASWTGKVDIVQALIAKANLQARNIMGKTAEKMALDAGHAHVVEVFKRMPRRTTKKNTRRRRSHQLNKGEDDDETVRIPLSDFIPSEAVETARAVLPTRLNNMLSTFYTFSINTSCVKNLGNAVGQVYNFMLDPF